MVSYFDDIFDIIGVVQDLDTIHFVFKIKNYKVLNLYIVKVVYNSVIVDNVIEERLFQDFSYLFSYVKELEDSVYLNGFVNSNNQIIFLIYDFKDNFYFMCNYKKNKMKVIIKIDLFIVYLENNFNFYYNSHYLVDNCNDDVPLVDIFEDVHNLYLKIHVHNHIKIVEEHLVLIDEKGIEVDLRMDFDFKVVHYMVNSIVTRIEITEIYGM